MPSADDVGARPESTPSGEEIRFKKWPTTRADECRPESLDASVEGCYCLHEPTVGSGTIGIP
jgi:hypothetical protein